MNTLKGEHIRLRALELNDLEFLYALENDESVWEVSNTTSPYSKFVLQEYLKNSYRDIYEVKQLRLVICLCEDERPIGFIDLFDFEPKHKRVGVGIIIFSEEDRNKGYALQSLELVRNYAFAHLKVHQIFANITEENKASIRLFEKSGFEKAGIKKDWIFSEGNFKNEIIYQLLAPNDKY